MDELTTVGQRIAYYRRRRGLTQEVLAGLVGRSTVWLSKIERGERTLDKISMLLALARVLKVSPGDLIGGIELPPNGGEPLDEPRGIHAIRRAMLTVHLPDQESPTPEQLRAEVTQANQLIGDGRIETVATMLPELLATARAAAAQDVPDAWWCLGWAYRVTSRLAHTLGEQDLAWLAADRAITAAERSGDTLLMAVSERDVAFACLGTGLVDEAGSVCSDAADAIAPTDATLVEGWSVWGSLKLTGAVSVTRAGDVAGGRRLLQQARAAAERVGPGRNDYWQGFKPANVGAHEVAVALESGDAVEALRIADTVDIDEFRSGERPARFLIDVAHAHGLRRDDAAAAAVLLEAERHAPEVVRYTVLAHELVRVLLGRERRSRTPGLRELAQRLGVAA